MKNVKLHNNIFIVARKSKQMKKLDYYIQMPDNKEFYMFTRNYSKVCYDICKAGTPVNKVIGEKTRNEAVMKLVKYLRFTMPYFAEEFALKIAA